MTAVIPAVLELLQQDPDPAAAERAGTLTQRCELSATAKGFRVVLVVRPRAQLGASLQAGVLGTAVLHDREVCGASAFMSP